MKKSVILGLLSLACAQARRLNEPSVTSRLLQELDIKNKELMNQVQELMKEHVQGQKEIIEKNASLQGIDLLVGVEEGKFEEMLDDDEV